MLTELKTALRPAIALTLLFALLLGLAYPLALTGICQLVFPAQANDSLVRNAAGWVVGSDPKPFDSEEVLARIRSAPRHRHRGAAEPERLVTGSIVIDLARRRVLRDGLPVHLAPKE